MNPEIGMISAGAVLLLTVIMFAFRRRRTLNELRQMLEFSQKQIDELQESVLRSRESNDVAVQRAADQARRIAWLESRMRKPRSTSDEVLDETIITETPKLSMTERRHRVISLANRGKSIESISTSLGLFKGEVELIVSLNHAALGAK